MRSLFLAVGFVLVCISTVASQRPWTEWDKKEVDKMLNGSAWGQTQAETDTSEMTVTMGVNRQPDAANNQALTFNYRIRFFSARPIREAFARKVMLENPGVKSSQLEGFINGDYSESIVIAVTYDAPDRRFLGPLNTAFGSATTETLRANTYLERSDGKRVQLEEYAPPSSDGSGAKFVFPRVLDGKPFVSSPKELIRFVGGMGRGVRISWRFKAEDMIYNGKLEY